MIIEVFFLGILLAILLVIEGITRMFFSKSEVKVEDTHPSLRSYGNRKIKGGSKSGFT
jgi:hypothetical protein